KTELNSVCLMRMVQLLFLGTALFLSASLSGSGLVPVLPACPLQVVLVFGLSVAMAAVCVGGGVHLNPAVTIAMALTLRLHLWRAVLYVIGQLLGGVASAALMLVLTGDVSAGVWLHQAVVVEMLVTLQLVLVVMATTDVPLPAVVPPLLVGLAVSLGHLVAVSSTGCGMNPARSFGPAVIALDFTDHWVRTHTDTQHAQTVTHGNTLSSDWLLLTRCSGRGLAWGRVSPLC
uniref:Uncharacterized protein n=1 Tax=Amphiprion percula TaxID=161767 RepID=A0A3P8SL11_AMPPE